VLSDAKNREATSLFKRSSGWNGASLKLSTAWLNARSESESHMDIISLVSNKLNERRYW